MWASGAARSREQADMPHDFGSLDRFRYRTVELHFEFLRQFGSPVPGGAKVLDFGCGIGDTVAVLLHLGYDAYGIDVTEFWGRDIGRWWLKQDPPPPEIRKRLFCVGTDPYRLPFADATFDFCFSDEVFEHVANPATCFAEIARVLKPGALSLHRFPGPNSLVEGHIMFPLAGLCHWNPWIALCAQLGFRPLHGKGWSARETMGHCKTWMAEVFYPSKRRLRRYARDANVKIEFLERRDFVMRDIGGFARMRHVAEGIGAGPIARLILPLFAQRYMLLRRSAA